MTETPKARRPPAAKEMPAEADAYSLTDFCARHSISLPTFYRLAQQGLAPATFFAGSRVLVSKEAAAAWRRAREAASAAAADAT